MALWPHEPAAACAQQRAQEATFRVPTTPDDGSLGGWEGRGHQPAEVARICPVVRIRKYSRIRVAFWFRSGLRVFLDTAGEVFRVDP